MTGSQYDLDDELRQRARRVDPETSKRWASEHGSRSVDGAILEVLRTIEPATEAAVSERVAEKLGVDRTSISPRFAPLRRARRIEIAGSTGKARLYRLFTGRAAPLDETRRGASMYQRLEDAAQGGRGIRLTAAEVRELARSIAT